MKTLIKSFFFLSCLFLVAEPLPASQEEASVSLFIDLQTIEMNKEKAENGNIELQETIAQLLSMADKKLTAGPYSVVFSKENSPVGNIHDYCSMSPYWWPDSTKEDGLPYIRKDGVVNPRRFDYDKPQSSNFRNVADLLTLAYLYTGDKKYSQKVIELIRIWFIDEATRMNPNMNYAQFVPGRSTGRNFGIIESRVFMYVMDDALALCQKGEMNKEMYHALLEWCEEFLLWLRTSEFGQKEHNSKNNHGTWYDTQTMGFSVLVGDMEVQKILSDEFVKLRINGHVLMNGEQPKELTRTRAFSYSNFNLSAMMEFYLLAVRDDVLSNKDAKKLKKGILRAAKYVYSYALEPETWPHQQLNSFNGGRMLLAQTYFTLYKLMPNKGYYQKAMSIPLDMESRSMLMLKNDFFKEK